MRQLVFVRKGRLEWRDVPEPELGSPSAAIVRPFVAARCDGDSVPLFHNVSRPMQIGMALHYLDPVSAIVFGKQPFLGPYPFGHECIAEVVSCGEAVRHFQPGQQVIVPFAISCGECEPCRLGLTSRCSGNNGTLLNIYGFGEGMGPWGGMVCDMLRVPFADAMLVPVPAGIRPVDIASASDNIPDGWRTVGPQLLRRPGAPVLIVGGAAQSIGLFAAAIAVAMGAARVDYIDSNPKRLAIAESLGAKAMEISGNSRWFRKHAPQVQGTYAITADCSASTAGLNYALRSLSPGGVCTGVGYYLQKRSSIPLMQMYINDSSLRVGVSHPRADLPDVLKLIQSGAFQPGKITTLVADWNDAPEAFLQRTTKVVIQRPPG